ncbi:MAG: YceH family protein [Xanthomonadales bacterium]|nr:YceH family protein [Xanthomonadales bacterium]MBK7144336.1 YceH family protein [Xanthomonadales bacterium]MCC6560250.1 YceH family protein [Xanthomonadales bacterium]
MTQPLDEALCLSPTEARIVGCLIEKAATTPEAYPLTVNSLVLAANQKTSREPLMNVEEGEVGHALRELEDRGWVRVVHGSRAHRYEHRIEDKLSVTKPQRALLCLLMLRGPQSAPELLTRSDRLAEVGSLDDVKQVLERLQQRGFVGNIGRASGQREDRYAQLFCGPVEAHARREDDEPATVVGASPLAQRVSELEAQVLALREGIAALEARVAAFE